MGVWKNTTVRNRLMIVIMVSSLTGLLLAAIAFVLYDSYHVKEKNIAELVFLSAVIAERNRAGLVFGDDKLSREGLLSLKARTHIEAVCIYNEAGKLFSFYLRAGGKGRGCPASADEESVLTGSGEIEIFKAITLNGTRIGTLYLLSNLDEIYERIESYALTVGWIALAVSVFTFLFSFLLQRGISGPLGRLSGTAILVAERHDYSVRASREDIVELQLLVDAFNTMLSTIEEQDKGLHRSKDELELLVRERTIELENKTARLEEADRLKSEFLSSVTHELKTPLNSIIGFSHQVVKKAGHLLPERHQRNMERVERNAANLLGLINELLEFSRLERGENQVIVSEFSLSLLLNEVAREFARYAEENSLGLSVSGIDQQYKVFSDRGKVWSILYKLLHNAMKFTEPGGSVEISAGMEEHSGSKWFSVTVTDTGIGISEDEQKGIFDEFRQVDGSLTRREGGTGIGLTITKRLVSLLSGRISLNSEKRKGATFKVLSPFRIDVVPEKKVVL